MPPEIAARNDGLTICPVCGFAMAPAARRHGDGVTRRHCRRSRRGPHDQAPSTSAPSVKPGISVSNIAPTADASAAVLAQVDFARRVTSRSQLPISSTPPHRR